MIPFHKRKRLASITPAEREQIMDKRAKRRNPYRDGFPVLMKEDPYPSAIREKLRYVLPNTYCCGCNDHQVTPTNDQAINCIIVSDSTDSVRYPDSELNLLPGNAILAFVCRGCIDKELYGTNADRIKIPAGAETPTATKWTKNVYNYLRSLDPEDRKKINVRPHGYVER